ncbi:esterase/lipase family protein [Archangium violaceum]|uniref:esterase/lipase family protein n=1 Tax=Archangium violaceum TaxID=83451 RepID=UPI0036DC9097
MQDHIVLVPGFGGFQALGSLRYYHGVTQALGFTPLVVHYFPNLPTASVQTRARLLRRWLGELQERGVIGREDRIHLVGHSTGGLDVRQLLMDYRKDEDTRGVSEDVLGQIRTVQFISTPQHGTNLAHRFRGFRIPSRIARLLPRMLFETTRTLREVGASFIGRRLQRLFPPSKGAPDWLDAAVQTMVGFDSARDPLERALARASYFETLRWLLDIATDIAAVSDLDPVWTPGSPVSPAHRTTTDEEQDFFKRKGIHYGSIVTVAKRPAASARGLYKLVYGMNARRPCAELGRAQAVPWLLEPEREARRLTLPENDGIVNSVSMVWPDAQSSFLVEADHADVIGHFRYAEPPPGVVPRYYQYDLLYSDSDFGPKEFEALWRKIAAFTQHHTYHAGRLPPSERNIHGPDVSWGESTSSVT